jgi:hypothetical protein
LWKNKGNLDDYKKEFYLKNKPLTDRAALELIRSDLLEKIFSKPSDLKFSFRLYYLRLGHFDSASTKIQRRKINNKICKHLLMLK